MRDCGVRLLRQSVTNPISRLPVISPVSKDSIMRMLETATNGLLAFASIALVAGVFIAL